MKATKRPNIWEAPAWQVALLVMISWVFGHVVYNLLGLVIK